jgi:hypothetical protein
MFESLNAAAPPLGTNSGIPVLPGDNSLPFLNSPAETNLTPDIFHSFAAEPFHLLDLLGRLGLAALLGFAVAWIYRRNRKSTDIIASFPTTLILLSILIAMVTQVIGDNVARAFSLVGALSIVRFRTVVRDTQDTAYVIFAVGVGMAVGALNPWVAVLGLITVGLVAAILSRRAGEALDAQPAFQLQVRLPVGFQMEPLLKVIDPFVQDLDLLSVSTAKQGVSMDFSYETRLRPHTSPEELVKALNRIEGVQSVEFQRRNIEQF